MRAQPNWKCRKMIEEKAPTYRISIVWENWTPALSDDCDEGFTERGEDLDRAVEENVHTCLSETQGIGAMILDFSAAKVTVERNQ